MEIINNIINLSLRTNRYFNTSNVCFLDIETTGLNRNMNSIYLIGVLFFDENSKSWILKQYFANNLDKEKNILEEFLSVFSSFDKIITYNGDSFDIPFIEKRLEYYDIKYDFDKNSSYDLYQVIRQNRYFLNLANLKLKTVELSLGIEREDKYSGKDCIEFYFDYINSKNYLLKDNILKHNYDDLVNMLDTIKILDVLDNKKSIIFKYQDVNKKFTINDLEISGDMLNINGILNEKLKKNIKYYDNNHSIVSEDFYNLNICIEFNKGYISQEEQCLYVDISDFNYLENIEDTTGYNLPSNILILMIEKKYLLDNIKNLLKEILENIII